MDIIIDNAGIASLGLSLEKAQERFLTNYYDVKLVNGYLIRFLPDNSHLVNVASELGDGDGVNSISEDLSNKYTNSKYVKNVINNTSKIRRAFISLIDQFIDDICLEIKQL